MQKAMLACKEVSIALKKTYLEKYSRFLEANPTMKALARLDEEKKAMSGKQRQ